MPYTLEPRQALPMTKGRQCQGLGPAVEPPSFQYIPCGATSAEERTFGGYTIPTSLCIGWWHGTERHEESIRLNVEQVEYK